MHTTVLPPRDSQRGAAQLEAARRSRNPTPEATALQLSAGRGRGAAGAAGTRRPRPRRSNCWPVEAAALHAPEATALPLPATRGRAAPGTHPGLRHGLKRCLCVCDRRWLFGRMRKTGKVETKPNQTNPCVSPNTVCLGPVCGLGRVVTGPCTGFIYIYIHN
jgi:hypothetical protein